MNFDAARDLLTITEDFNGDGRPEVMLLFNTAAISGNWGGLWGVLMVEDAPGRWREACSIAHRAAPSVGPIRLSAAPFRGWRNFRTDIGRHGWRPMADGSGRMECGPSDTTVDRPLRGPHRSARWVPWRAIDPLAASALRDFRNSPHPIADAMAINHEGDRIGVDRSPGRLRNFDASSDLLYAVRRQGRGWLVFILFDWPMLRPEGGALPGVVMLWDGQEERARIACTIHDRGDRGAGGGVTLLDARGAGLPDFRTSAGRYAWRVAPGGAGPPECHLVGPR
ncbi:hypothetical protein J5Y09_14650 [Roseomonas sp. PWR1]|uniref:VCBS repeat-containing protein n=1 Tax=Roseomonas nitratireducens TaxID=2820810 RepID=A0ABS4AX59_9PROT|nr:hypothetical protein [Neoroseomonas nitratireducens]MBP0465162.1 hypothetical protein [Neoroseomonas nitratireducens]